MKYHSRLIKITAMLSLVFLVLAVVLQYCFSGDNAGFWSNVSLGIFGSSLLTMFSSIIGYNTEKRRTLESFFILTHRQLHYLEPYNKSWSSDEKVKFFLEYEAIDRSDWNLVVGEIEFFFDHGKWRYIYDKIYNPIRTVNEKISLSRFHFRDFSNPRYRNEYAMSEIIKEIETLFIEERIICTKLEDGTVIEDHLPPEKLITSTLDELNGRYYEIMYGKKKVKGK